ncbi:MAG: hypothetical protein EXR39_04710 [Betaproteobacteria bacterium]|nr:hypothetical protein [Betaproteobacteria bacterium]
MRQLHNDYEISHSTFDTWASCRRPCLLPAWQPRASRSSRYNGPMTPWFMRRNEIWLALQ